MDKKTCFLITPIGEYNSPERKRVDQWLKLIYVPALDKQYDIIRADKISTPGKITAQILDHIIDCDLSIIDYSNLNPNVMYEAAIRHITQKPFIQIQRIDQHIPFDIKDFRCISYNPNDLEYPKKLMLDLKKCVKEINSKGYKTPEMLSQTFDLERIVSDPEKFVELLKKHFIAKKGELLQFNDSPVGYTFDQTLTGGTVGTTSYTSSASTVGSTVTSILKRCPYCHSNNYRTLMGSVTASSTNTYACNNCGAIYY